MQKQNSQLVFSASDLVNFLECEHLTSLDLINLETPLPRAKDDEQAKLIQDKGFAHEAGYLEHLRKAAGRVIDLSGFKGSLDEAAVATLQAMREGADVIFQATLRDGPFIGYADFLRRVATPSAFGDYSYEVVDTKLARSTRTKFLVQLLFYSELLGEIQGTQPRAMHVVLGDGREETFRVADYVRYFRGLRERFLARVADRSVETYPEPCDRCDLCKWRELCGQRWLEDDHLSQVAGITRVQIKKLVDGNVHTLAALGGLPAEHSIDKMHADTLAKLRHQARLQLAARETGKRFVELLPSEPGLRRGLGRLPKPDEGDMFFDMEGDPLEDGGLEYLFGLYFFDAGKPVFKPFWAHSRPEERTAFEAFMDFVSDRLVRYPDAHIYHYAHYEVTALKKLMSLHGTREAEVDALLRRHKLVDLYKVVREGLRVSEPSYSIKNIEHFYMPAREGEVKTAGTSVVYYERWKQTRDAQLLQDIEDYNRDDVISTQLLRDWLLSMRPDALPWANLVADLSESEAVRVGELSPTEARLVPYRERLVDTLPAEREMWSEQHRLQEFVYQLLDFHRRAAKPEWWAMYARQEMTEAELVDDAECIGAMWLDPAHPPHRVAQSLVYTYRFPEQEFKFKVGDSCLRCDTLERAGTLVALDEDACMLKLRLGIRQGALPERLCIGPTGPISSDTLVNALYRYADALIAGTDDYRAVRDFLTKALPRLKGQPVGVPLVDPTTDVLPQAIEAVSNLDESYLFIQGPPGAGKTFTGSHIIVELLRRGFRVGVTSNSHKAIHNLLDAVEKRAVEAGMSFRGAKKRSSGNPDSEYVGRFIVNVESNKDIVGSDYQLVAGTAWLFAEPGLEQSLDYLFVDEAGQVAVANLVAMGLAAKSIVLLGDQMQLGQPIQGVHPGRSGESTLEYLLDREATIAPGRGIFLAETWRMHPNVCRFISDAVYDGRLRAQAQNENRRLILKPGANEWLTRTGIRYVPIAHDGCSQRSEPEAKLVRELFMSLLEQEYVDRDGQSHPMTPKNILVVAPYNMQVNLLKATLPDGARVGTVDKFQGQEAEVVIVSMATSSGEYLPRFIEFLYSKNRLNVAISRARCLALLVASPALMAIPCSKPQEMALVNTLCWARDYSESTVGYRKGNV